MLLCCLKYRKNTESKNLKAEKKNKKKENGRIIILSSCAVCISDCNRTPTHNHSVRKKSAFIKKQEASGLLSSLMIKIPLNKIPSVAPLLI